MQSTLIPGVPLVYLFIEYSVLTSSTSARETKLAPLRPSPFRWGWPQLVQPGSPYPFPVWERIQTQAHRDPFIALHIQPLPLQWYLTLHLHIHIFRTWCSLPVCARYRENWAHQNWCVFISFQGVFVIVSWKWTKGAADCLTLNSSARKASTLRIKNILVGVRIFWIVMTVSQSKQIRQIF